MGLNSQPPEQYTALLRRNLLSIAVGYHRLDQVEQFFRILRAQNGNASLHAFCDDDFAISSGYSVPDAAGDLVWVNAVFNRGVAHATNRAIGIESIARHVGFDRPRRQALRALQTRPGVSMAVKSGN